VYRNVGDMVEEIIPLFAAQRRHRLILLAKSAVSAAFYDVFATAPIHVPESSSSLGGSLAPVAPSGISRN